MGRDQRRRSPSGAQAGGACTGALHPPHGWRAACTPPAHNSTNSAMPHTSWCAVGTAAPRSCPRRSGGTRGHRTRPGRRRGSPRHPSQRCRGTPPWRGARSCHPPSAMRRIPPSKGAPPACSPSPGAYLEWPAADAGAAAAASAAGLREASPDGPIHPVQEELVDTADQRTNQPATQSHWGRPLVIVQVEHGCGVHASEESSAQVDVLRLPAWIFPTE
eukprot:1101192-Heterocapsa_arctica.AAC.1